MNRDDLLQKCIDRGVADEASVSSVSHLFYVYLLSALQRGQRVEIPNFGTFGTRVVGVKRARRMPFFEVEQELAQKVNERYRQLKFLVVGRYEYVPASGEEEYKGKEVPHDGRFEDVGKEVLLDMHKEVPIEEYELGDQAKHVTPPAKEKKLMPKLNLKDEEMGAEGQPQDLGEATNLPPTLHETPTERGLSPLLQVALAVIFLGLVTFALNYFGVVHLWGKKTPAVVEALPPPEETPAPGQGGTAETPGAEAGKATTPEQTVTPTPVPSSKTTPLPGSPAGVAATQIGKGKSMPGAGERKTAALPPSTGGNFTVQISSWASTAKANAEAARLTSAGYTSFVEDAVVGDRTWHRVRIGKYATAKEAEAAAAELRKVMEDGFWVAKSRVE
jgi:cell division septation protein DedD